MSGKIKAVLINMESSAKVEAEIDLDKPFTVNIVKVAKRSIDFQRDFISPEDRDYLKKDALDKKILDTMKVNAIVGEEEIELDTNKTVADSWSESVKDIPLSDGQAFKILVNGFSRDSNEEMLVPTKEESTAVDLVMVTRLLEENKRLIEDKRNLVEDKKLLNQVVASLREQVGKLNDEIKVLRKRPTKLRTFLYAFTCIILGAMAGAVISIAVTDAKSSNLSNVNSEVSSSAQSTYAPSGSGDGEIAVLTEGIATLTEENEKLKQDYDELVKKYNELEKEYADKVKEKDEEIAKLEKEKEGLEEKLKKYEESDSIDSEESTDSGELTDSVKERKVDSSLIQDVDKGIEILTEDDNTGKTISYNSINIHKEGIIANLSGYFPEKRFSVVVPEGYNSLDFDIGHIMDSGNMDAWMDILIDNTKYEEEKVTIRYNESVKRFNVKGLKPNQIVTIVLGCEDVTASTKYGITNMVLHQE